MIAFRQTDNFVRTCRRFAKSSATISWREATPERRRRQAARLPADRVNARGVGNAPGKRKSVRARRGDFAERDKAARPRVAASLATVCQVSETAPKSARSFVACASGA
jgi:hypothetical protein